MTQNSENDQPSHRYVSKFQDPYKNFVSTFLNDKTSYRQHQRPNGLFEQYDDFRKRPQPIRFRHSLLSHKGRREKIEKFINTKRSVAQKIKKYLPEEHCENFKSQNVAADGNSVDMRHPYKLINDDSLVTTHSKYIQRQNSTRIQNSISQDGKISLNKQYRMLQMRRNSLEKQYQAKQKAFNFFQRETERDKKMVDKYKAKVSKIQSIRQAYRKESFQNQMSIERDNQQMRQTKFNLKYSVLKGSQGLQRSRISVSQKKKSAASQLRRQLRLKTQQSKQQQRQLYMTKLYSAHKIKQEELFSTEKKYQFFQQKIIDVESDKLKKIESQMLKVKKQEQKLKKIQTQQGFYTRSGQKNFNASFYANKIKEAKKLSQQRVKKYKDSLGLLTQTSEFVRFGSTNKKSCSLQKVNETPIQSRRNKTQISLIKKGNSNLCTTDS